MLLLLLLLSYAWLSIISIDVTIARSGSYYGKSNNTIHLSNVQCDGDEERIADCIQKTYSLEEGKNKLKTANVAGVRCSVLDGCVSPPTGGAQCIDGSVRLVGERVSEGEGLLEYCHKGYWTPFCSLNVTEATVACRQLGYEETECMKHNIIITKTVIIQQLPHNFN